MSSNTEAMTDIFFSELKQYNSTNFRSLVAANLSHVDSKTLKAFSSVVTRYWIFCEKHPEISELDARVLYFKLKIDMIARFFANYPDQNTDDLVAFQTELKYYVRGCEDNEYSTAV